jgi:D-amino-acid dehydrogenase
MTEISQPSVAIVGAGIVGICAAVNLAEAGYEVTVIDRTGVCEETSSGNAGALAFTDMLPLVQKGVIRNLPRWLADPLGPLAIRPSYLPALMPWLVRFWRAGRADRFEASLAAQASLMTLADAEWMALLERSGTRPMLREDGALELYESEAEFRDSLPGWDARARFGVGFRHVEGDELAALQPGLSRQFVKATFVPDWKTVADPKLLGKAVWAHAQRSNRVAFRQAVVERVEARDSGARVVFSDGSVLDAGKVVIAAGAWSHQLARPLGDRIPLETERGYNTTLPVDAFDVKRQLIFPGHGFVITPMETGLRVGGAVEFGGLKLPPNYQRSKAMLEKTKRFLPGIRTEGGREWMGYRPSMPDSLPVIGHSKVSASVIYAFGHGHLGLTQSAATGRLVRDLVTGEAPAIDIKPFSPRRF